MALTKISDTGVKTSNTPSNGKFLQYKDDTDKLTWTTVDVSDKADLSGSTFTGNVILGDGIQLRFGANQGSHDLLIYHDGNKSILNEIGSGPLVLASNQVEIKDVNAAETMATFTEDGGVSLYHDDAAKLATSSTGITVTGTVAATSFTGSGANLTNLPPAGNTFEIVADGAIGAGKAVQIKSNGKVEEIKETVTESNLTQKLNNAGLQDESVNNPRLAYDNVGRYLLHTWMANESGYEWTYYRLYILNSTGTGWTYGNQTKLISTTYNQQPDHVKVIAEPNQGKFVMFSGKDRSDSNKKAAWVGTPDSGGSITWSDKNTVDTSTYETNKSDMCFDSTNDMVVVAYAVYNTGLKYVAGTMSNSGTMTWGSATTAQSGSGNSIDNVSVDYDSTTNRIVVIYKYENPSGGNRYGKMKIGQRTSANTITWGSEIEWHGHDFQQAGLACAGGKVVITFSDKNDNRKLKYRVGTLSSSDNTITWGSTADTGLANHSFYNDLCYVPSIDKLVLSYTVSASNTNSGNDDSRLAKGAISGTSITWSNSTEFDSSRLDSPHIIPFTGALGTNYGGIAHTGSRHSNGAGYQYVWHTASATSNLERQKVVGFAPSAISDGATGTINTDGNTVTVSGLTAGTKYYVQGSGALGTGTTDSGGSALEAGGVALSANKLLIKLHH